MTSDDLTTTIDAPGKPSALPNSDLSHVLYVSTAKRLMGEQELADLLSQSQRNNQRDGITGMLLYDEGSFIQYIEGRPMEVSRLWQTIKGDSRHTGVLKISDGPVDERLFADWSMGFKNAQSFGGFHLDFDALQKRVPDTFPTVVRSMMRVFYRNRD